MNRSLTASLLALARLYPWVVPALVVLGLLASLAEGIGIGLLIPVLDDVVGDGNAGAASSPLAAQLQALTGWIPPDQRLWVLGTMIATLVALKTVLMVANNGVSVWVSSRLGHDLRVRLGNAMLHADYAYVTRLEQGRVVNLFENQSDRAAEAMTLFANFVSAASTVLVFALLLALLSWQLALVVLAVVLPVSLFVRSMTRSANRLGTRLVEACALLTSRVLEVVGSVRTIRLFGSEEAKGTAFAQASSGVRRAEFRANLVTGSIQPLVEFLYVPVFFAVLALALRAGIGLPVLFAFLALLYRLQTPLKRLDHLRVELSTHAAAFHAFENLLAETALRPSHSGRQAIERFSDRIEFENVSFAFEGSDAQALRQVEFTIRRGTVVALVGRSGSGKSTLVNLLCSLYTPTDGRILVDGIALSDLDVHAWRRLIGLAGQDADLLTGTVRDNVTLGRPDASEEQIAEALRLAHATEFVAALPQALDTEVGPRGASLSGGQRQRIALARAFLRAPDLLILDEATNAVDSITETEIQAAIEALSERCTILVIAHRLATLHKADEVVVLDAGRVVQRGSPQQLLAVEGLLARQYALE